jgi:hypothetical protein
MDEWRISQGPARFQCRKADALLSRVIFPCGDARFTNQRYRLGGIKVFEIFRTTKPAGTGLGLPLVGQIVSAYRGAVDYFSEPGKGTNI